MDDDSSVLWKYDHLQLFLVQRKTNESKERCTYLCRKSGHVAKGALMLK